MSYKLLHIQRHRRIHTRINMQCRQLTVMLKFPSHFTSHRQKCLELGCGGLGPLLKVVTQQFLNMCLGRTGLLMLAVSEDTIFVLLNTHTHTQVITSADGSDVTSIRFSALKAKTAEARTEKDGQRVINQETGCMPYN